MISHETLNKAINLITEQIDARHVMWELTHDDLEVKVESNDHYLYYEWIIRKRGYDDYHPLARIETNIRGTVFTLTVRAAFLPYESNKVLEDYGFYREDMEFFFDTNSPKQILAALDLAVSHKY